MENNDIIKCYELDDVKNKKELAYWLFDVNTLEDVFISQIVVNTEKEIEYKIDDIYDTDSETEFYKALIEKLEKIDPIYITAIFEYYGSVIGVNIDLNDFTFILVADKQFEQELFDFIKYVL